jgi:hypothetical protein
MSTKHTQGPWEAERINEFMWRVVTPSVTVCSLECERDPIDAEAVATLVPDASLIAAAPDLLRSLIDIVAAHEADGCEQAHHCERCTVARAAIAKARGES